MIQSKYQTFGKRFVAAFLDGILFIPLSLLHQYLIDIGNSKFLIASLVVQTIVWTLYVVIGHGKYGQTLGKKIAGIMVLDLDEESAIGYRRAFLRESVWFIVSMASCVYATFSKSPITTEMGKDFSVEDYLSFISVGWLLIELISMAFNSKRRAIHDFMANSVVVDLRELGKSKLA